MRTIVTDRRTDSPRAAVRRRAVSESLLFLSTHVLSEIAVFRRVPYSRSRGLQCRTEQGSRAESPRSRADLRDSILYRRSATHRGSPRAEELDAACAALPFSAPIGELRPREQ